MKLPERFVASLEACGVQRGERILMAVSGGCDSVSLLHLLRFCAPALAPGLVAAHFDHAMRAGSDADAAWVAGLCRAWQVPLRTGRAGAPLRSETDARAARYAFLRDTAREVEARWTATAHHADDQAETVLFRALRGTGVRGLGAIPPRTREGLIRPLLPFWKTEIRAYARSTGLRWRRDPSNRSPAAARNRLRLEVLPRIEATVAPRARRSLVRLAALAQADEAAWEAALERFLPEAAPEGGKDLLLVRRAFRAYHPALAARVLRAALRRVGSTPDRAGTRATLQFISHAPVGRSKQLPGGLELLAEWEHVRVRRGPPELVPDVPLRLSARRAEQGGSASALLGGERWRVEWGRGPGAVGEHPAGVVLPWGGLRFPLELRARRPGDRIRTAGGTKTLKRFFGERRIPRAERPTVPVLVDAAGEVLWVMRLAVAVRSDSAPGDDIFFLRTIHA